MCHVAFEIAECTNHRNQQVYYSPTDSSNSITLSVLFNTPEQFVSHSVKATFDTALHSMSHDFTQCKSANMHLIQMQHLVNDNKCTDKYIYVCICMYIYKNNNNNNNNNDNNKRTYERWKSQLDWWQSSRRSSWHTPMQQEGFIDIALWLTIQPQLYWTIRSCHNHSAVIVVGRLKALQVNDIISVYK